MTTFVEGDFLIAHGASGAVDHYHADGTYVRSVTTNAHWNNGLDVDVEVWGICFDNDGNFYCVIPGLRFAADPLFTPGGRNGVGPQIQKFSPAGADLGVWSQVPFNYGTSPAFNDQLIAWDIQYVAASNRFLVSAVRGIFGTPPSMELWLLAADGTLANHWTASSDPYPDNPRVSIGADGNTAFYVSSQGGQRIFRWDISGGVQLADFVTLTGADYFNSGLTTLPDGGVIACIIDATGHHPKLVRYDSGGAVVWMTADLAPKRPAYQDLRVATDGLSVWMSEGTISFEQRSIADGSLLQHQDTIDLSFPPPDAEGDYGTDYVPAIAMCGVTPSPTVTRRRGSYPSFIY